MMRTLSRYLLVGFLTVVMAMNSATAARWYGASCCPSPCPPVYVEVCPPIDCCPVVIYETPSEYVSSDCQCDHWTTNDGAYYEYSDKAPSQPRKQELIAPPEEPASEAVSDADQGDSSVVNKPPTQPDAKVVTPAPVIVPEENAPETPAINEVEPEPAEDSLFDSVPLEEPAEETPGLEIFDEPAPAEDNAPLDEMPAEQGLEENPSEGSDPIQDLFGPTSDEAAPAESEAPVDEPATQEEPDSEGLPSTDDLFGAAKDEAVLHEPGGMASRDTRKWTDNTARYHCEARMLRATPETVLLAKSSGKQIAVRFSRLSDDDLRFVRQQVLAKRQLLAKRASTDKLASLWSE